MIEKRNDFHSRKFRLIIFIAFICVFVLITRIPGIKSEGMIMLSSAAVESQQDSRANAPSNQETSRKEPAPATQRSANPSVNAVTEAAVKLGILSCVSRINQVATFLTSNNQAGVFIFNPLKQPDEHIFSTSFELIREDNSTFYASASFFPNKDAVYDTVEYVDKSCDELEKTVFQNLRRIGVVKKNLILLDGGNVKVFLMPAGSGCVVIKKEVIQ